VGKLCCMFRLPGGMAVLVSVSKTFRKDSVLYSMPGDNSTLNFGEQQFYDLRKT
jgi:hypothetical protein